MSIEIRNVSKQFGSFVALKDICLQVNTGELVALLGPSGSGKTTLLRIIAGLEQPDTGSVLFHGEDSTRQHARERGVGFVFQHYALFRHMSIFENVAFGLRVRPRQQRPSDREIRVKVHQLLSLVQLDWIADRYPNQLSGGQRQRVALARALAVEPKVLLLDEPFGALDAKVRKELRRWLRRLHDEIHVTSVFVTHDQEEALEVADRIAIFNEGELEQVGTPEQVYDEPATPFVYSFLGTTNAFSTNELAAAPNLHSNRLVAVGDIDSPALEAIGYARPHEIEVSRRYQNGALRARVVSVINTGPVVKLELTLGSNTQLVEASVGRERFFELRLTSGDDVFIRPTRLRVFAPKQRTQRRAKSDF